jgi:hypothetical protein
VCFTVVRDLDRVMASMARLALSPVHREPTWNFRRCHAVRVVQIGLQQLRSELHDLAALGTLQRGDRCPWRNLTRPEDLAAIHVADPAHHALVEQHFGDSHVGFVVVHHSIDAFLEIRIHSAQIGSESTEDRVSTRIEVAIRLDDWCAEAHGDPIFDCEYDARTMLGLAPPFAHSIEVPRARHAHVRMQHDAVIPDDLEVFATTAHFFDRLTNLWSQSDETWSVEVDHLLAE